MSETKASWEAAIPCGCGEDATTRFGDEDLCPDCYEATLDGFREAESGGDFAGDWS